MIERRYIGPFTLIEQTVTDANTSSTLLSLETAAPSANELLYITNPAYTAEPSNTASPYITLVYHRDHLGSVRAITTTNGTLLEQNDYYPFGLRTTRKQNYTTLSQSLASIAQSAGNTTYNASLPRYLYNGKEKQEFIHNTNALINIGGSSTYTSNYIDYGARFYNPVTLRWTTQDPMAEKYTSTTPYSYCVGNPINLIDADGKEPIKPQAGTVQGFINELSTTGTKSGLKRGISASQALLDFGKIEFDFPRPMPAKTGRMNKYNNRYIYTEKGGWIDMAHFMFYAGRAYKHKQDKEAALELIKNSMLIDIPISIIKTAFSDPVGEALQEGFLQERADLLFAPHSAYSYEDLPSDKLGAIFGAKYFDLNSNLSLGEQLNNYLNKLGATTPEKAPNYQSLPLEGPKKKPSRTNKNTLPVYTKENP